jgi:hypothetical protein
MRNDEKFCFYRNNSLKRSFKKINNDSSHTHQIQPHHCTIELKTKAASCLHLHPSSVILTTFKNQSPQSDDQNHNPQQQQQQFQLQLNHQQQQQQTKASNEILWHYQQLSQCDLVKKIKSSSQCNLNILRHNYHHHYQQQQQHQQQQQQQQTNNTNSANNNNNTNSLNADPKFHNSTENQTTL